MSKTNRPKDEDSGGSSVPAWMVTFSDCMTLLLCFFVLLMTFSSFEKASLKRLSGALGGTSFSSIFPNRQAITDALVPPPPTTMDHTDQGAEKPTDDEAKIVENPRRAAKLIGADAYRDRNTVRIPSARLFHAMGSGLKPDGTEVLKAAANFMRRMPCKVVVCQNSKSADDASLGRAWAIMRYFTQIEGLASERFSISAGNPDGALAADGSAVVEIIMLARDFLK